MERLPQYPPRPHKSGQARIKIRGTTYYLGKFGTPESHARYRQLVSQFAATGIEPPTRAQTDTRTTVAELAAAFLDWADQRYRKHGRPTSEPRMFRTALGPVVNHYADLAAADFGPRALSHCRDTLAQEGICRTKINQHLSRVRRVWKWGVARELVPPDVWTALTAVEGLRAGEARERPPVTTVASENILAIKSRVLPPVWAMVELQLATGMRPGEVVLMRTCDVRRDDPAIPAALIGKCWVYRPESHKTEHHGRTRLILLGPQAIEILSPWLRPDNPQEYLFSPAEGMEWRREQMRSAGKSHRPKKRATNPQRAPGKRYTAHAYCRAIRMGCSKADVPNWSPNQLRHNAATAIRQQYGIDVARTILGHAHLKTTEVYAEIDLAKAVEAMSAIG